MTSPHAIFYWIERHVKPMRRSRQKTLASVVAAAMCMTGAGVLALGRAMQSRTTAKHAIKRVWRFFRNELLEIESIQQTLATGLAPPNAPVVILLDWTEYGRYQTLCAALPRDGRALPLWWKTIVRHSGKGSMVAVEQQALWEIRRLFPFRKDLILIADRGFGNTRWIGDIEKWGWEFVQRISGSIYIEKGEYYRALKELPVFKGSGSTDWGEVLLSLENPTRLRLVTTWKKDTAEPWYLVTNLERIPQKITRLYLRRMWIEEMFRDLKNRNWGLGFDGSELASERREDRRWAVLALAYLFLMAYGAAAEEMELHKQFSPNTERERVISLARLGAFVVQTILLTIPDAIDALNRVPP